MAGSRSLWRALVRAGVVAVLLATSPLAPAGAQDVAAPILTLDQDRFFRESAFGRAVLERERTATRALETENTKIEAALIDEEQDLTERRPTLASEDFTKLASAFDQKVESIRAAQDAKARDIGRARDADRATFRSAAIPVLAKLMTDKGALVIMDQTTVILSLPAIDVTAEAIVRIDAALGPGKITPATEAGADVIGPVIPSDLPAPDTSAPDAPAPDAPAPDAP